MTRRPALSRDHLPAVIAAEIITAELAHAW